MTHYDISLRGGLCGQIWMPNTRAGKDITVNLSREMARFTERPTMRELLLHVLMEHGGDFQSASFTADTEITVSRDTCIGERRKLVSRAWSIQAFKSVSDLVDDDAFSCDFGACDDDC